VDIRVSIISYAKSKLSGIHHAQFGKHGYFFSWENEVTKNLSVAWFTGRNICRRHCMDLVSLGKSGKADLFEESRTGKSFSDALILESVNPQYDERLFIEFPEKYKFTTFSNFCAPNSYNLLAKIVGEISRIFLKIG
jgi:hypothetical protein